MRLTSTLAVTLLAVLAMNVQVLTRFVSACPAFYWAIARSNSKAVTAYGVIYTTLGSILFPLFLPWT